MSDTLELTFDLVRRASLTPDDAGCQWVIGERLQLLGFCVEHLPFGAVSNLWARLGSERPLLVFAGHTDVVPPGPLAAWSSPPFEPSLRDGWLFGRGVADMKGSLAAMVTACERLFPKTPIAGGSLAFLITSDEEGPARNGTAKVVEALRARGENIDLCLVGEPSSRHTVGDVIKNGRRGSLNGYLRVRGRQGHVAYPQRALNPIHRFAPVLVELDGTRWDDGNEHFPPTTFQVSNLNSGTGADNVIPGELDAQFNFRYSTAVTRAALQQRLEAVLVGHGLDFDIEWRTSGDPFLTEGGALLHAVRCSIRDVVAIEPQLATDGGTSDGRFIAPAGAEVVELGPVNSTIHKIDECLKVDELDQLSRIYERILMRLLGNGAHS